MAVPLDNPSYFTLAGGATTPSKSKFRLFKKKMGTAVSAASNQETDLFKSAPGYNNNNRKQLRSLLRSVSSNSADSNQELLVLGEPRPSDIAPPSPYLPAHRNCTQKRGQKRTGELSEDLVYCPLATSEEAAEESAYSDEEEEVFLTGDSAKYYNIGAVGREAGRRHSIGTYLIQERERALSVASTSRSCKEEAIVHATIDGDVVRPGSVGGASRKYSFKGGTEGSPRRGSMDDILIVSSVESQAACLWVSYFNTCFEQYSRQKDRPVPKIFHLGLEEATSGNGLSSNMEERISTVKLQLVIVCPLFLDLVAEYPVPSAAFGRLFKPDRTIAMLLGVTDESLTDVHHTALGSYRQWQRHAVGQDQDQSFVRHFLAAAINILTKVAHQERAQAIEERTTFSVMPKKVKQSQNRLIILLAEPLTQEDNVKVSIDKNGEMIEIKTVKRRNPYTLKFSMPESCLEVSLIVSVLVEKNGDLLGARPVKCESRLRELDQILRSSDSPLEFMCQTLGFNPSSREQLDNWMAHSFQKNLPPHFNLLASPGSTLGTPQHRHVHGQDEYPTLLHFAARFGLEKLAWQLLECPGGDMACDIRNVSDLTPAEMAEAAGHVRLASTLSGYMQMNEFTNMYSQLKEMSLAKTVAAPVIDDNEYLEPRRLDQTYSVPPPARPFSPVLVNRSVSPASGGRTFTGYMQMQPSAGKNVSSNVGTLPKNYGRENNGVRSVTPQPKPDFTDTSVGTEAPSKAYEDKVQGELLEIINDFKNNVFTLSEVEQLVDSWRNRNDVQKSSKDKQEQLNAMRQEYDRIQQIIKADMKTPTPFERIKRLFSRSKPKEFELVAKYDNGFNNNSEDKLGSDLLANCQNHRPISSLSLQSTASTSSSGRMSTLSGCSAASLGDSGTHSDHEDRKHLMRQTSSASEHEYIEINDPKKAQGFNYLIPPTPKPVYKYNPLKPLTFTAQQFTTITERPPQPVPRIEPTDLSPAAVNASVIADIKSKLRTHSPLPEPQTEYLNFEEEPLKEYMNMPSQNEADLPPEMATEEHLPEYMNVTISPELPPRKT